jgi:predicted esterase
LLVDELTAGAPSADGAELGATLADAVAAYNVGQSRIYLWGFSAGAHFAHALALGNTDYFAAYGVSAGSLEQYACTDNGAYPPTCAALLDGAQPKIPVDIHLGNTDPVYLTYGAGTDPARFQNAGWVSGQTLFYTLFAGGHTYTVAQLGEIWDHLCPFALGPWPRRPAACATRIVQKPATAA